MKVSFKEDVVQYSLDKGERDDIRHVRNLTKEIARFIPEAAAASKVLTNVLNAIDEDGTIGSRPIDGDSQELAPRTKSAAQPAGGSAGDK